jgi:ABC-type nitrate/sulfonate/bicarbonate transport system permease component
VLGGFILSAIVGTGVGLAMAMSTRVLEALMPLIKIVMGVPALTWVLLSIIWFKSAEARVWFIMFILVFPIMTMNTYDGVRAVPHDLYHMVRSLRPTTWGLLKLLIVPAATPFIFSGLKVSLSFGGRIAVFAEALSASTGIGAAMYTMDQMFDTAGIIVWTVLLVLVLSLLDKALALAERRWFRWRHDFQGQT